MLSHWKNVALSWDQKFQAPLLTCYTLTNSYLLEQIEYLVQHLPEVHFEIAAYTYMAVELLRLSQYPNVSLYPNTYPLLIGSNSYHR